jgi:hypothetical protein
MTFIALVVKMGHDLKDTQHDTTGQELDSYTLHFVARPWHKTDFFTSCAFCVTTCRDLNKIRNMTDWKLQTVFDTQNVAYAKFYNPLENLAVDGVIVKLKGRIIFRQYISKKRDILISKFTNCVTNRVTLMIHVCT